MDKLDKPYQLAVAIVNLTAPFASSGPFSLNLCGLQRAHTNSLARWMEDNYEIVAGVLYAVSVMGAELQDTLDEIITEERLSS